MGHLKQLSLSAVRGIDTSWFKTLADDARVKRTFDICVAGGLLILFMPILLIASAMIYARDGAPILFVHKRVGKHGKMFGCYKFRTMVRNSQEVLEQVLRDDPERRREWDETQKLMDDPRILGKVGKFLRKTSFDELPQLLNILKGDMSVVGPRPIVAEEVERYGPAAMKYITVRPGLTGAWQVGGRSSTSYEDRVAMDVEYIDNWNVMKDIVIVSKTVKVVLGDRNAA